MNGTLAVDDLQPTIRAATDAAAPIAYLEFDVAGPDTVTTDPLFRGNQYLRFRTIKNPVINGFEIDTPNSTRIANYSFSRGCR